MRPIFERFTQRLAQQQGAKTGAINEQVARNPLSIAEGDRDEIPCVT
jgi:hypothetical protein